MKVIAVFAAVLAVSSAQIIYNGGHIGYAAAGYPGYFGHHAGLGYSAIGAPAVVAAPAVIPSVTKTQYHAQDVLGQASFGHSEPNQAHSAVRDAAGGVRGTFSYISPEGIPFTTNYIADHNGYRAASNAIQVDTPEVAVAKVQHAAAHTDALLRRGKRGAVAVVAPAVARSTFAYQTLTSHPAQVTYAAHHIAAPAVTYGAVAHHIAAPAAHVTYGAVAPAVTYGAVAPAVTYGAAIAPAVHHVASPLTYSAVGVPAVRAATLTRVVNTPGHAVSYRVD